MRCGKLIVAGTITAFFLFAALAFGAETYPFRLADAASIFRPAALQATLNTVQYQYGSPPKDQYGPPRDQYGPPSDDQYDDRADVCVDGIFQLRLSKADADQLIGHKAVVLGRCSGPHRTPKQVHGPVKDTGARLNVCVGGLLELRASKAEANKLIADKVATRGPCPAA